MSRQSQFTLLHICTQEWLHKPEYLFCEEAISPGLDTTQGHLQGYPLTLHYYHSLLILMPTGLCWGNTSAYISGCAPHTSCRHVTFNSQPHARLCFGRPILPTNQPTNQPCVSLQSISGKWEWRTWWWGSAALCGPCEHTHVWQVGSFSFFWIKETWKLTGICRIEKKLFEILMHTYIACRLAFYKQ
jgi:hypothetical protein